MLKINLRSIGSYLNLNDPLETFSGYASDGDINDGE